MRCARSLSRWRKTPAAAARLIGGRAIRSESIDIGVAVEAQDGIMVPVIRNADKTSLADLTSRYTELVDLARRRRLTAEMTSGGIASVSNFGTFGLDWGTPIPLPDQTLLLGLGAGKKAPIWTRRNSSSFPRRKPNSRSASIIAASTAAGLDVSCSRSSSCSARRENCRVRCLSAALRFATIGDHPYHLAR